MQGRFKIVTPVYNAEKWIGRCIKSVLNQDFPYDFIIVDDASTDNTLNIIRSYGVFVTSNLKRVGSGLANIIRGIDYISDSSEDIIVTLDGDDYFADSSVLSCLNEAYKEDVWMTYGSFLPESRKFKNTCSPLDKIKTPTEIGNLITVSTDTKNYRRSGYWVTSHLRTFKRWLWNRIKDEDLRDADGEYYKMAWDMAFMYPMIEMSGEHLRFIDKILYIYNDLNPNSDGITNPELQVKTGERIQAKDVYDEL